VSSRQPKRQRSRNRWRPRVKITQALAVVARARIGRRISFDVTAQNDSTGAIALSETPIVPRDARGRFVRGHAAGGPGRPPRDCFRALNGNLFLSWSDTADKRCGNSAKRIRHHICGL
jgi:hypothetical protein